MRLDMRIPVQVVVRGQEPPPSDSAVLVVVGGEDEPDVTSGWAAVRRLPIAATGVHDAACACCSGRSGLAEALGVLFAQRARTQLPWFNRVVLSVAPEGVHETAAILQDDILVSGRFRRQAEN